MSFFSIKNYNPLPCPTISDGLGIIDLLILNWQFDKSSFQKRFFLREVLAGLKHLTIVSFSSKALLTDCHFHRNAFEHFQPNLFPNVVSEYLSSGRTEIVEIEALLKMTSSEIQIILHFR